MMRKAIVNIVTGFMCGLLLMPALMGCSKSSDPAPEVPKYITVAPAMGTTMTRTYTDSTGTYFAVGDQVTVYAWTGASTSFTAADIVVDGVPNTLGSNGQWTSLPQMMWGDMVSPHYFLGIYPPRQVADLHCDLFTLSGDYAADDLLVGTNFTGIVATGEPVGIVFDHILARLQVNLLFKTEWETTPSDVAVSMEALNTCTIDYILTWNRFTPTGLPACQSMAPTTVAPGFAKSFHAIMVPQAGFSEIKVRVDGRTFTYIHPKDIPLRSGSVTTVNLTLGRNVIELSGVSIDEWEEGRSLDGTGYRQ